MCMKKSAKKRLNITLPADLVQKLDGLAVSKSQFIAESVEQRIKEQERAEFEERLKQGYIEANEYNLKIAKEWEHIDFENWPEY